MAILLQCTNKNEVAGNSSYNGTIYLVVNYEHDSTLRLEINGTYYRDSADYVTDEIVTMFLLYNSDTVTIPKDLLSMGDEDENCKVFINFLDSSGILIHEPELADRIKYSVEVHNECNYGDVNVIQMMK